MLHVIAIVGTSGKSTTAWLTRHLLKTAGVRAGMMSSVGNFLADDIRREIPQELRHADAPYLEYSLEEIAGAGCTHAVIECSVKEARLQNLPGVQLAAGIWTTLQADDMDFEGDVESNFHAKWAVIAGAQVRILNARDDWARQKIEEPGIWYGDDVPADWRATEVNEDATGFHFTVHTPVTAFRATLPMPGRHNVSNALAALAAASRAGVGTESLAANLKTFRGIPARMQVIAAQPVRVIVDFANTPSRLAQSLRSLHATTARELIVVTGSHDDPRYVNDRAALGAAAAQYATRAIFTESGYHSTSPLEILDQVLRGAASTGRANFETIPDRVAAIRHALDSACDGDTVLIAGKGTESSIERGAQLVAWDEAGVVRGMLGLDG